MRSGTHTSLPQLWCCSRKIKTGNPGGGYSDLDWLGCAAGRSKPIPISI